ncbi:MAG: flippase-like domain-containing protein [Thermoproteota archaeon]
MPVASVALPESLTWVKEALRIIGQANPAPLLAAVLAYASLILLYSLRWLVALRSVGVRASISSALKSYFLSLLVNNITPSSRAGGELVRAGYIYIRSNRGTSTAARIATALAFERLTEAIPAVGLAILAAGWSIYAGRSIPIASLGGALLVVVLLVVGVKYWDRWMELAARKLGANIGSDAIRLKDMIGNRRLMAIFISTGVVVWALDVVRIYLVAAAVGAPLSGPKLILATITYIVLGLFSLTPGGLGIVEGGFTATLKALGLKASEALSITLLERAISYGLSTLMGLVVLAAEGGRSLLSTIRSQWR